MNNTIRERIERKSINIISKIIEELPQVLTNFELLNEENNNLANLLCDYNKLKLDYNNLEEKYNNQRKRIEKYEEIYSTIPGTTKEDKDRFLAFIINNILPWLIESSNSRTFKKVVEFWHNFIKKQRKDKKSIRSYYVYSHTIIGETFPFYIGFSRNNDGQYNRSKEYTGRHEKWHEYVNARGNITDMELEKFYINHYSKSLVNHINNNAYINSLKEEKVSESLPSKLKTKITDQLYVVIPENWPL